MELDPAIDSPRPDQLRESADFQRTSPGSDHRLRRVLHHRAAKSLLDAPVAPSLLDAPAAPSPTINMSGVWGWFGGGAAQKRKDSPKNAILGLRAQLDMLQKRERHLQTQMDEQEAIARKNVNTNKNGRRARRCWRRWCAAAGLAVY